MEKILKKEANEFEDVAGTGASNAKLVYDKIIRTLKTLRNVSGEYQKLKLQSREFKAEAEGYEA